MLESRNNDEVESLIKTSGSFDNEVRRCMQGLKDVEEERAKLQEDKISEATPPVTPPAAPIATTTVSETTPPVNATGATPVATPVAVPEAILQATVVSAMGRDTAEKRGAQKERVIVALQSAKEDRQRTLIEKGEKEFRDAEGKLEEDAYYGGGM